MTWQLTRCERAVFEAVRQRLYETAVHYGPHDEAFDIHVDAADAMSDVIDFWNEEP